MFYRVLILIFFFFFGIIQGYFVFVFVLLFNVIHNLIVIFNTLQNAADNINKIIFSFQIMMIIIKPMEKIIVNIMKGYILEIKS